MKANYVLCVGGSGAKSGEALLHLLSAGVSKDPIEVHFLDQDITNGNLVKVRRLADTYKKLHKHMRPVLEKLKNRWLFAAELNEKTDPVVYPPVHPPFEKLGQLFQRDLMKEELRHFFDSLFDFEAETNLELVHGFRGRPAIGQAVLAAGIDTKLAFWDNLKARLSYRMHNAVHSQKYFLMGSVFGGTGAAGVPTVARELHRMLNLPVPGSPGLKDPRGTVGAALFLPYFSYPNADLRMEQATGRLLPSATMMVRARLALDYYQLEMDGTTRWSEYGPNGQAIPKRPPHFDSLYVVGWPELINLGYVSAGGGGQDNPALLPEMLGALAAFHFFRDFSDGDDEEVRNGRVYRAGFVGSSVDWEDLPSPNKKLPSHMAMRPLAVLIRFAFAYKYVYYESLFGVEAEKYRRQAWYRNLMGDDEPARADVLAGRLLLNYCDSVLRWAASLTLHGKDPKCNLFNVEDKKFASFTDERDDNGEYMPRRIVLFEEKEGRADLMKGPDEARYLPLHEYRDEISAIFDKLVTWTPQLCDLGQVYKGLCSGRPESKDDRGLAAFAHFLWVACAQSKEDRL